MNILYNSLDNHDWYKLRGEDQWNVLGDIHLPAGPSHNCEHFFRQEYMTEKSLIPGLRKACSSSGDNSAIQPINISILSFTALYTNNDER